jgi:hypothetical protein
MIFNRGIPFSVIRLKMTFTHGLQSLSKSSHVGCVGKRVSLSRWHARLSHPHQRALSHVVPVSSNKSLDAIAHLVKWKIATNCLLGLVLLGIKFPLELFYLDLWGPASVSSLYGNNYFLSIANDFSHYTWCIPISSKSDVTKVFAMFQKQIERSFNRKIIVVQADAQCSLNEISE